MNPQFKYLPPKQKSERSGKPKKSAYLFYLSEVKKSFQEAHPDVAYRDIVSMIGKKWNSLDSDEKKVR